MKAHEPHDRKITQDWASRRKATATGVITVSRQSLVEIGPLDSKPSLPLLIRPSRIEVSLAAWARDNLDIIERELLKHGGVLFRGFNAGTQDSFEQFVDAVCPSPMIYMESATPRTKLSDKVYTSTEFPSEQTIALHNELSYVTTFPTKIWFCCIKPAERGGQTLIADVRKVLARIPDEIKAPFIERGWMLVRNFGDGFGPTWQDAYHLSKRAEVEQYFRNARIAFDWKGDDRLRTRQVRPAIVVHPKTGEALWFNHTAFWHVSNLEPEMRAMLQSEFQEGALPYNTYYGDGSRIEDSVIEKLNEAYSQETILFDWEAGDILMLDNMLVAHGRASFTGSRKVLAAMGEPYTRTDL